MRIVVKGHGLPGLRCGPYGNVHVALQVGSRPEGLVPGDAPEAEWTTEVRVITHDDGRDFRGSAVHGKRSERFLYLTWGEFDGHDFAMFRRAKLMLDDLPVDVDDVTVHVELTDAKGMPSCARLREPVVRWVSA
jgi:hypothetical protein